MSNERKRAHYEHSFSCDAIWRTVAYCDGGLVWSRCRHIAGSAYCQYSHIFHTDKQPNLRWRWFFFFTRSIKYLSKPYWGIVRAPIWQAVLFGNKNAPGGCPGLIRCYVLNTADRAQPLDFLHEYFQLTTPEMKLSPMSNFSLKYGARLFIGVHITLLLLQHKYKLKPLLLYLGLRSQLKLLTKQTKKDLNFVRLISPVFIGDSP